jgi:hypothetical protein
LALSLGSLFTYNNNMVKKSISVIQKTPKRGRPATGTDPLVALRLPEEMTARVDDWAKERELNRSAAIRQLIELGLASKRAK